MNIMEKMDISNVESDSAMQTNPYAYHILKLVTRFLEMPDLVACSQVCKSWRDTMKDPSIWTNRALISCALHFASTWFGLEHCLDTVEVYGMPMSDEMYINLESLKHFQVHVHRCDTMILYDDDSPEELGTVGINPSLGNLITFIVSTPQVIRLNELEIMKNLAKLYIDVRFFHQHFFSTSHKYLENLWFFGIGYTFTSDSEVPKCNSILAELFANNLKNIMSLAFRHLLKDYQILTSVSTLPKLKCLELTVDNAKNNLADFLPFCQNIDSLHLIFRWPIKVYPNVDELAIYNGRLLDVLSSMSNTLKFFTWEIDYNYYQFISRVLDPPVGEFKIPFWNPRFTGCSKPTAIVRDDLEGFLHNEMPNTVIGVKFNPNLVKCWKCDTTVYPNIHGFLGWRSAMNTDGYDYAH
ncbi:hypothetical protein ABEB36_006487 [Hypothenemus hampei]|uniref:F-box domain-containing protein n=1 Tax=Hypothenemus hampei TaxID=57062 RepID=A0ABD1EQQ7_HYPHA